MLNTHIKASHLIVKRESKYIAITHCLGYVSADDRTTAQYGKQDVEVTVMICQNVHLISCYDDGPLREHNASNPLMHEHDNLSEARHYQRGTQVVSAISYHSKS